MNKIESFRSKQDSQKTIIVHKPSLDEKLFFFISGMVVSIPFTILFESLSSYLLARNFSRLFVSVFSVLILAPLIEEFAKAYPLFYRHGETGKSMLVLGLAIGLGFGIAEFAIYVFMYNAPVIYRIPGVLFHATAAAITAYGITVRKPVVYYVIATFFHFSYNLFAQSDVLYLPGILAILASEFLLSYHYYKKASEGIVG